MWCNCIKKQSKTKRRSHFSKPFRCKILILPLQQRQYGNSILWIEINKKHHHSYITELLNSDFFKCWSSLFTDWIKFSKCSKKFKNSTSYHVYAYKQYRNAILYSLILYVTLIPYITKLNSFRRIYILKWLKSILIVTLFYYLIKTVAAH